jgi:hypothetical protein
MVRLPSSGVMRARGPEGLDGTLEGTEVITITILLFMLGHTRTPSGCKSGEGTEVRRKKLAAASPSLLLLL